VAFGGDSLEKEVWQGIWLVFSGVCAVMVFARASAAGRLLRNNPFIIGLFCFAGLSTIWSINPSATVARLFHLLAIFLCCLAASLVDWHPRRFQEVVRPIFTLLLIGSLVFALIAPDLASDRPIFPDTTYILHGLADQKNQLGALASMGAILWVHGWLTREVKLFWALLGGGAAFACLLLSHSSTSLFATILVCIFLYLMLRSFRTMKRYTPYIAGVFVAVTLIYTLALLGVVPGLNSLLGVVADLTGKDRTFSNRTQIWELILAHINQSPILGSGYGAYWKPGPDSPSYIFLSKLFFYPGECHNGYLEIINDIGYAGLLLLIGYLATYLRQAVRMLKTNYSQAGLYLAMLIQQLITNLTESHWFFMQSDCLMFTFASLCLARSTLGRDAQVQESLIRRPVPLN